MSGTGAGPGGSHAVESLERPLWRALAAFRVLALVYAVVAFARIYDAYRRPVLAGVVLVLMGAWTLFTAVAYRPGARPRGRARLLAVDLAVAAAAVLATRLVDWPARIEAGAQTLPIVWPAGAVIAWAIAGGPRYGAAAAGVIAVADLVERGEPAPETIHNIVLLLLLGAIVGYAVALVRAGEQRVAVALQVEGAMRERERLARDIHDEVLQVLALVQRRGAELGGEAAELGRLAGKQEAALRALVTTGLPGGRSRLAAANRTDGADPGGGPDVDLRSLLVPQGSDRVTVSAPASPVAVPAGCARELAAAVNAALDNVTRHAGPDARAWVLLEDEPGRVIVTVRDDGAGMEPGRVAQAAEQGRLGLASSICGRLRDLGGTAHVISAPGQGTEVELVLPRKVRP